MLADAGGLIKQAVNHPNLDTMNSQWYKFIKTPADLMFWSACLLLGSMPTSPFLLSVGMWGLAAAALWNIAGRLPDKPRFSSLLTWVRALGVSFINLYRQKELLLVTLLLLAPALSLLWSDDQDYWLRVTRVRLPFLVLPLTFASLPELSERRYKMALYILVWFMVLLCIGVGINFLIHYDEILTGLGRGQPVPVPRQHVRFSLILATTIITGGWLWNDRFTVRYQWERGLLGGAVIFLFLFIHVLSVRGGLAVLYAALLFTVIWYVVRTRRWAMGLSAVVLMGAGLWVAIENIPSLRMRVAYMRYDWLQYQSDSGASYSDSERWVSLKTGWKIWQQHPVQGVGAGDLQQEVRRVTTEMFPGYAAAPLLPHNQWIHILASTGIIGLLLSIPGFLGLFLKRRNRSDYLLLTFYTMAFLTFLIECTIENAVGVAWFLFFPLWFSGIVTKKSTEAQFPALQRTCSAHYRKKS